LTFQDQEGGSDDGSESSSGSDADSTDGKDAPGREPLPRISLGIPALVSNLAPPQPTESVRIVKPADAQLGCADSGIALSASRHGTPPEARSAETQQQPQSQADPSSSKPQGQPQQQGSEDLCPIEPEKLRQATLANIRRQRIVLGAPISGGRLEEIHDALVREGDEPWPPVGFQPTGGLTNFYGGNDTPDMAGTAELAALNGDGVGEGQFQKLRDGIMRAQAGIPMFTSFVGSVALSPRKISSPHALSVVGSARGSVVNSRSNSRRGSMLPTALALSAAGSLAASKRGSLMTGPILPGMVGAASGSGGEIGEMFVRSSARHKTAPAQDSSRDTIKRSSLAVPNLSDLQNFLPRTSAEVAAPQEGASGVSDSAASLPHEQQSTDGHGSTEVGNLRESLAKLPSNLPLKDLLTHTATIGDFSLDDLMKAVAESTQETKGSDSDDAEGAEEKRLLDEICEEADETEEGEEAEEGNKALEGDLDYPIGEIGDGESDEDDGEPFGSRGILDNMQLDPGQVQDILQLLGMINDGLQNGMHKKCKCQPGGLHTCMTPAHSNLASQIASLQVSLSHSLVQSIQASTAGTRRSSLQKDRRTSGQGNLKKMYSRTRSSLGPADLDSTTHDNVAEDVGGMSSGDASIPPPPPPPVAGNRGSVKMGVPRRSCLARSRSSVTNKDGESPSASAAKEGFAAPAVRVSFVHKQGEDWEDERKPKKISVSSSSAVVVSAPTAPAATATTEDLAPEEVVAVAASSSGSAAFPSADAGAGPARISQGRTEVSPKFPASIR